MLTRLFAGRVALVTGGASGIGRAAAVRYGQEGACVLVADIDTEGGAKTAELVVAAGGEALFVRTDVTQAADVAAMVEAAENRFGRLDAAFNNAGTPGRFTDVVACEEDEWDFVINLNLKSVWLCMKYEIPGMLRAGGGAIVNASSQAAEGPAPHMATYVATKAGVIGLTRSAALDFGPKNIRINALLPGPTVTPMLMAGNVGLDVTLEGYAQRLPLRRVGQPHEQADAVIWLTSAQSSFVTGLAVPVDGGLNL